MFYMEYKTPHNHLGTITINDLAWMEIDVVFEEGQV